MSTEKRQLLRHQILVLCRGDEVVAGVGQSGEVRERLPPYPAEFMPPKWDRTWEIDLLRLVMPAEVPTLSCGEGGLSLRISTRTEPGEQVLDPELIAEDLTYVGTGCFLQVDASRMVIYELAKFETRTRPAFLGPEPEEFR